MTNEQLIEALKSVVWYNGYEDTINNWINYGDNQFKENKDNKYYNIPCPYSTDEPEHHMIFWMICVELFGECGTSPRYGWINIDKWKDCKKFLSSLLEY